MEFGQLLHMRETGRTAPYKYRAACILSYECVGSQGFALNVFELY